MPSARPAATPLASARERFDADLAQAPRYPTVHDLVEVLGGGAIGRDRLVDAYAEGWLSAEQQHLLHERAALLQCWLLARLVRLALVAPPLVGPTR